jgi:cyclohexanone monooxygenase
VADRFELWPHMRFDTRVAAAHFDAKAHRWSLQTEAGDTLQARFCVMATGLLSAPNLPQVEGAGHFGGVQVQTSLWPKDGVELAGKRVAVIGTGSSAVQAIPEIAKQAGHLTVFQRTPVFAIPSRNAPADPDEQRRIKARYAELREKEMQSLAGFASLAFLDDPPPPASALDVDETERRARYDRAWAAGGLSFYNVFPDLLLNAESNETVAQYMREKIRERVGGDPRLTAKLTPTTYPVLTKRLCADSGYYETYLRDNVELVDLRETPIERITETGIQCGGRHHELDIIVWATGFDAMPGALDRIDIRGRGGRTLRAHWAEGLRSFAGLMCEGFPNLIFMNGPGSPSAFFAPIQLAEYQAGWISRCLDELAARELDCMEVDRAAEDAWVAHHDEVASMTLLPQSHSWYMGDNIPGKPRRLLIYIGGFLAYRDACEAAAADGFSGLRLSGAPVAA